MTEKVVKDIVCSFCGCLCDDIEALIDEDKNQLIETYNACTLGFHKISALSEDHRVMKPMIRKNGELVEVSLEEAIEKAAQILVDAKWPLLYGWSSTSNEAISAGLELTEEVQGVMDNTASVCHGPSLLAVQDSGYSGSTLGDVKNRATVIVYWASNPMAAHPRHLARYTTFMRGYFRERGVKDRTLVVVDPRNTDTAKIADHFYQIKPNGDYELVAALRAAIRGLELKQDEVAGLPKEKILEMAKLLKEADYGALFFGLGLTMSKGKHRNVDNAISLIRDLNSYGKWVLAPMRGHYNVAGANVVSGWTTGYGFAIDFSLGYPRYNPGEYTSVDMLCREEPDAMLSIAADPAGNFPAKAVKHMHKIPVINIDPHYTPTTEVSDVVIPVSIVGVEAEGTAYRMDRVPIRLRKFLNPPEGILSDEEILKKIIAKAKEIKAK
ncbi:MAG: formylmethanofuran dehydrogenase subunit B [Candidatus Helarchaeota archaeon]